MKDFSVIMSLVDYIPVALFAAAAILLQRSLYYRMSKGAFALFAAGTIYVISAGLLKATYKLLYALNICDFQRLSDMMFPGQAIGFLLAGIGMVAMLTHRQKETLLAVAPPVFTGTIIFITFMVLGLGMMDAGLCVLAKRLKKPLLIVFFAVSFVCSLGMGYLSTRDFSGAAMNWIAEGVNIVGEGMLLLGVVLLRKNGLVEKPEEN
ncbi:MAG: hypothetical protein IJS22_03710 [Lachnospiraceae bacterium]|nr:hypothetical protein [Lachnospiraceae bacterium]